jgi:hypothetical protein
MPERSITNVAGTGRSQLPSAVGEVVVEDLEVQVLQIRRDGELHPIGGDDLLVDVAQHVETEFVLLRGREAVVGGLGADGHEGRSVGLETRKGSLQGPELEVAEGAPLTSVERENDRPLREAQSQPDGFTEGVR